MKRGAKLQYEYYSYDNSIYRSSKKKACMSGIKLETEWPVALDSPDHTHPWGVYRDNTLHEAYLKELIESIQPKLGRKKVASLLDLGCAGGIMVTHAVEQLGMDAVGLEGSDYWAKKSLNPPENRDPAQLLQWRKHLGTRLFTCDISRPFTLKRNGEVMKFDFISAWEVVEHIHPDRLTVLFDNIKRHLKPTGIFLGSISTNNDASPGIELHQSVKTRDAWLELLKDHFSVEPYTFRYRPREDGGSFHVILRDIKSVFKEQ